MNSGDEVESMTPKAEIISFPVHGDERGALIALEGERDIPFEVRRVYYIYGTRSDMPRAFHAHKHLKQLLVAVSGSVTVTCEYGRQKEKYLLDSPSRGLLLEGLVWREMHDFSPDCVLVVFASEHYREEDYIRDYQVFKQENLS